MSDQSWEEHVQRLEANNAKWAHIALPDGTTTTSYWTSMPDDPEGRYCRDLNWWQGIDGETTVCVHGDQFSDTSIEKKITVYFDNNAAGDLTGSTAARELAARLFEAADRFDEINGVSGSGVIVIDEVGGPPIEVSCTPFEPDDPSYRGERLLCTSYDGREESGVVLDREQCAQLAAALLGGESA